MKTVVLSKPSEEVLLEDVLVTTPIFLVKNKTVVGMIYLEGDGWLVSGQGMDDYHSTRKECILWALDRGYIPVVDIEVVL